MDVRTLETSVHGRYLVEPGGRPAGSPLLVGFHGYAENAERLLDALRRIPGADGWVLVAVQGLHRFYDRRDREVVASWMTRQDRELAVMDNVRWVDRVIDEVRREFSPGGQLVLAGFSQGVPMTWRAALLGRHRCDGLLLLAGDLPPELAERVGPSLPPILLGRGRNDRIYTKDTLAEDRRRLEAAPVEVVEFDGGHGWEEGFLAAAGRFLAARRC